MYVLRAVGFMSFCVVRLWLGTDHLCVCDRQTSTAGSSRQLGVVTNPHELSPPRSNNRGLHMHLKSALHEASFLPAPTALLVQARKGMLCCTQSSPPTQSAPQRA
jgi:hypothetical protein